MRADHTTNSTIVSQVRKGEIYTIIEIYDNWGKLKSGAGWICLDYTKEYGNDISTGTNEPIRKRVIAKTGLNIRQEPGGNIVGALKYGEEIDVYETMNGWARIGDNKWVYDTYLEPIETTTIRSNSIINEGDIVQILTSANKYVTGETIPSFVKGVRYTVQQKVKDKILLKEIKSWVFEKDLTK